MSDALQCTRCGNHNTANQKFCTNCGQKLTAPAPAAQPSPASSTASWGKSIPTEQGPLGPVFRILRRILALAALWLPRIPILGRLSTILGVGELARMNPFLALGALGLALLLGLYKSPLGHIDTVPFLYPIMAIISSFNPALGMVAGVAFGIGDLIEKMATNQVYYSGMPNVADYLWGLRAPFPPLVHTQNAERSPENFFKSHNEF